MLFFNDMIEFLGFIVCILRIFEKMEILLASSLNDLGVVVSMSDGIARVYGLSKMCADELTSFVTSAKGISMSLKCRLILEAAFLTYCFKILIVFPEALTRLKLKPGIKEI